MTEIIESKTDQPGWGEIVRSYRHPRVITMLFLGFSAGLPILLIFSSLSIWLIEAGVARSSVTLFSWAALGYSFKFIWAPLVDKLPLPILTRLLGRRRGWLLFTQLLIVLAIGWMAFTNPAESTLPMAFAAVMLGFSSATQDIVIDALRIESAPPRLQALISSAYIAGYRIGMLAAGAGALKLAAAFGSTSELYQYFAWRDAYLWMSALMLVGMITTLVIREPEHAPAADKHLNSATEYVRFLSLFLLAVATLIAGFLVTGEMVDGLKSSMAMVTGKGLAGLVIETLRLVLVLWLAYLVSRLAVGFGLVRKELFRQTYIEPTLDFFHRYGRFAMMMLLLVGLYRISDIVLGVISNVFYTDKGYDKDQIANIAKTFGLLMTLLGGFLGGGLALKFGVMRILLLGAVLSAVTNLLFMLLAESDPTTSMLIMVIAADNLSGGIASAAFIAYLSGLTNISFTAFQYAVFSSLMTLFPKLLGGYSGAIVDTMGYSNFFLFTALLGVPVILVVWLVGQHEKKIA